MKALAIICAGLGIPATLIGLLIVIFSDGEAGSLGVTLIFLPWGLALLFWFLGSRRGQGAFTQLVQHNLKADHSGWFDASGIAIDVKNRKLVLANRKRRKVYSFDEVREWSTSFETGGTMHTFGSVGVNAGMQVAGHNAATAIRNYAASGLFVRVRDIEHPEWHIRGVTRTQATRWMEVLNQSLADPA